MTEMLDYRIVAGIARTGSLTGAARELDLTPAMVSKRLTRLEKRLGVRLFNRTTRSLSPTDAGERFNERVTVALTAIDEAEGIAAGTVGEASGVLRVSAPTSFGRLHIAPALPEFLRQHPKVQLSISLTDDFVDLVGERIDVAIRIAAPEDSSLVARRLATNRRILCAAPAYLKDHGTPRVFDDLRNHALLAASGQSLWKLVGPDGPLLYRARSLIKTDSSEVVRAAMLSGLGIGLRSTWDVGEQLRSRELVQILPDYGGDPGVGIYVLYASRALVPLKVRAFVDFISTVIPTHPAWDRDLPIRGPGGAA